jgi:ribonuclease P protein component
MLPKRSRIPRELFSELLQSSKYAQSPHFTLRFRLGGETGRFGVSVSKKISKSAVTRNTVRRRVYAALYPSIQMFPKGLFLVVAKTGSPNIKGEKLQKEISNLFAPVVSLSV